MAKMKDGTEDKNKPGKLASAGGFIKSKIPGTDASHVSWVKRTFTNASTISSVASQMGNGLGSGTSGALSGQPVLGGGSAQAPGGPGQVAAQKQEPSQSSQAQGTVTGSAPVDDAKAWSDFHKRVHEVILRCGVQTVSQTPQAADGEDFASQHYLRAAICNELFAAAVAQELRNSEAGRQLNGPEPKPEQLQLKIGERTLTNQELQAEMHRAFTPIEEADYKAAADIQRDDGIRKNLAEKLRNPSRLESDLSDREMDIIHTTAWRVNWKAREDLGLWPPKFQDAPENAPAIPTPPEALVNFMVDVAYDCRKTDEGRGRFIGSLLKQFSSESTKSIGTDETGYRGLMDKATAKRIVVERSAECIEETVGRFRDLVKQIYLTPKNELVPELGVPGMMDPDDKNSAKMTDKEKADKEKESAADKVAQVLSARFRLRLLTGPKNRKEYDDVPKLFNDQDGVRNTLVSKYVEDVESVFTVWKAYAESVQKIRDEQVRSTTNIKGEEYLPLKLTGAETLDQAKKNILAQIENIQREMNEDSTGNRLHKDTAETLSVVLNAMKMATERNVYFSSPKEGIEGLISTIKSQGGFYTVKERHAYPIYAAAKKAIDEMKAKSREVEQGKLSHEEWMIALGVLEAPKEDWAKAPVKTKNWLDNLWDRFAANKVFSWTFRTAFRPVRWTSRGVLEKDEGFPWMRFNRHEIPATKTTSRGTVALNWAQIDAEAEEQKRSNQRQRANEDNGAIARGQKPPHFWQRERTPYPAWRRDLLSWKIPVPMRNHSTNWFPVPLPNKSTNWWRPSGWRNHPERSNPQYLNQPLPHIPWYAGYFQGGLRIFGTHQWARSAIKPVMVAYLAFAVPACYATIRDSGTFWGGVNAYFARSPASYVKATRAPGETSKTVYGGSEIIPDYFHALDDKKRSMQDGLTEKEYYLKHAFVIAKGLDEPAEVREARGRYREALDQAGAYTYIYSPLSDATTTVKALFTEWRYTYPSVFWLPIYEKRVNHDAPVVEKAEKALGDALEKHHQSAEYKKAMEILQWMKKPENYDVVAFYQERSSGKRLLNWAPVPGPKQCNNEMSANLDAAQSKEKETKSGLEKAKKNFKADSPEVKKAEEAAANAAGKTVELQKRIDLDKSGSLGNVVCRTVTWETEELGNPYRLVPDDIAPGKRDELIGYLMDDQSKGITLDKASLNSSKRLNELASKGFLYKRREIFDMQAFGFKDQKSARMRLAMGDQAYNLLAPYVSRAEARWWIVPGARDKFMRAWNEAVPDESPAVDEALDSEAAPKPKLSEVELKFFKIAPKNDDSAEDEAHKNAKKMAVVNGWVQDVSAEYERRQLENSFKKMKLDPTGVIDTMMMYPDLKKFVVKFLDPSMPIRLNPVTLKETISTIVEYSGLKDKPAGFTSDPEKDEVQKKLDDYNPFLDPRPKSSLVPTAINVDEFFVYAADFNRKFGTEEEAKNETMDQKIERILNDAVKIGPMKDSLGGVMTMMYVKKRAKAIESGFNGNRDEATKAVLNHVLHLAFSDIKQDKEEFKRFGVQVSGPADNPEIKIVDEGKFKKEIEMVINRVASTAGRNRTPGIVKPPKAGARKNK